MYSKFKAYPRRAWQRFQNDNSDRIAYHLLKPLTSTLYKQALYKLIILSELSELVSKISPVIVAQLWCM